MARKHDPHRRTFLQTAAAASVAGGIAASAAAGVAADASEKTANPIPAENAKEGTTDWQLTYVRVDPKTKYRSPWIEGFVSRASVKAGESLELFVSTQPAAKFRVDFYRLGYYGGAGGRHVLSLGPFA